MATWGRNSRDLSPSGARLACWGAGRVMEGEEEAGGWVTAVAEQGLPGPASLGVGSHTHSARAFPLVPSPGLTGVTQARHQPSEELSGG